MVKLLANSKFLLWILFVFLSMNVALAITSIDLGRYPGGTELGYVNLRVEELKYEPYPVEPGEYFELWFRIENIGKVKAVNVTLELLDTYPFYIDKIDDSIREFSEIRGNENVLVKYKVRVDEDAVEGDADLKLKISTHYPTKEVLHTVSIRIQEVIPILSISVISEPEKIPAGSVAEVIFNVKNSGSSLIEDIAIKLELSSSTPFVPVGSITEKKIQKLAVNKDSNLSFTLMAEPDAVSKPYRVPIKLTYYDEIGNNYTKNETIGLFIGSAAEFDVNIEETDIYQRNKAGMVLFNIYNYGTSDLKFLSLELVPTNDYVIVSNPRIYIGDLDSDDYESAEFQVYVKRCWFFCEREIPLRLSINYKDSYNEGYSEIKNIPLKMYYSGQIRKYNLVEKSKLGGVIIFLILLVLTYLVYRTWKKEKDFGKALNIVFINILIFFKNLLIFIIKRIHKLRWHHIKRLPRRIKTFFKELE